MGKESACNAGDARDEGSIRAGKVPWRKRQPTSVFLPGESHGQRSLADYSPWGREESDTTEDTGYRHIATTPYHPSYRKGTETQRNEVTCAGLKASRTPRAQPHAAIKVSSPAKRWTALASKTLTPRRAPSSRGS